jgi:DNA-binding response OmpR family regulator
MIANPTRPILLVEDNPMDVDLTIRAFKHNNMVNPVIVLRDGEEASLFIENLDLNLPLPLLVLLDLKLPKVYGLEVLKLIRQRKELVTVPVVVLTSSAEDKDIQKAYELGANSYIIKPIDFEKFIDVAKNIQLYWVLINTPAR